MITIVLSIALALALLWLVALELRLRKYTSAREEVIAHAAALETHLEDFFTKVGRAEARIEQIMQTLQSQSTELGFAVQHIGLIRFNPFNDTGGDQSFSLALLDRDKNGVIISTIWGREGTRVYGKPIIKGSSAHNLSEEEQRAIAAALSRTAPPAQTNEQRGRHA